MGPPEMYPKSELDDIKRQLGLIWMCLVLIVVSTGIEGCREWSMYSRWKEHDYRINQIEHKLNLESEDASR